MGGRDVRNPKPSAAQAAGVASPSTTCCEGGAGGDGSEPAPTMETAAATARPLPRMNDDMASSLISLIDDLRIGFRPN
jgi:hypothetical protein